MATDRPWLDELTARYGEPKVHAGPTPLGRLADSDGQYQRECWAWFPPPDLRNHNMSLDQYEGHWMIRAAGYPGCGHPGQARVRWPGTEEPPAEVVRAALVSAGLLPAELAPARSATEWGVRTASGTVLPCDDEQDARDHQSLWWEPTEVVRREVTRTEWVTAPGEALSAALTGEDGT